MGSFFVLGATFNQVAAGLIVAFPSIVLAYLGYRKSQKVDAIAARAGIIDAETSATQQVLEGLDTIIQRLSEDNVRLRKSLDTLWRRLDKQDSVITELRAQVDELKERLSAA